MPTLLQEYQDLIACTLQYLKQEFPRSSPCNVENATSKDRVDRFIPKLKEIKKIAEANTDFQKEKNKESTLAASLQIEKETMPIPLAAAPPFTTKISQQDDIRLEKENSGSSPAFLKLEPLAPASIDLFKEIKEHVKKFLPELAIVDIVPSDTIARQINTASEYTANIPPVLLFSFHGGGASQKLLQNLTRAINLYLTPAKIISSSAVEKNNDWLRLLKAPQLRLIITSQETFQQLTYLQKYYRKDAETGMLYLQDTPLFLISDLTLYLQNPHLKAPLWDAINQLLV